MSLPNGVLQLNATSANKGKLQYHDRNQSEEFEKEINLRDWTPIIISYNQRTVTASIDGELFVVELHESGT